LLPHSGHLAGLLAERLHRQRQHELLAQQLDQIHQAFAIEGGGQVVFPDLDFSLTGILGLGHIAKIEGCIDRHLEGLETAATVHLEPRPGSSGQAEGLVSEPRHVEHELHRRCHPIVAVLRLECRRRERPLEVLTLPVQLVQVEKHLSKRGPPAGREPVIIP
jgi:hypothetical protein